MDRLSQPNTYHRSEMSSKLEAKLQELRDELELLTSMVRAERLTATAANQQCTDEQGERAHKVLDQCIAFASVPQQDVGAGRSVPSPVGQEQQNSDVLGDAEDGPRSTLQVLASEGSGLSTAIAIAEVKAMLEEIVSEVLVDNINGAEYNLFVAIAAKRGITLVR